MIIGSPEHFVCAPETRRKQMRPQPLTPTQKCTLGCPILDRQLGGGIPCNSITELVAESGSGKTQLCLQLCLSAQLPTSRGGLSAASLYLHTEFPFPIARLHELSTNYRSNDDDNNPCDEIFVDGIHTACQLLDIMPKIEFFIRNTKSRLPIKLIVIDSIAALFRSNFENTPADLGKRSSLFFQIAGKLKALASDYGLAVVVTNQVADLVGADEGARIGNLGCLVSSGRRVRPTLGLAWANCVNSRLFIAKDVEEFVDGGDDDNGIVCARIRRWIHVVFAPHLGDSSCEFDITRNGVFGVHR